MTWLLDDQPPQLAAALAYHRLGLAPVWLPEGGKSTNERGWQNRRHTEAQIVERFSAPCNVGVLTGEPSGGLADVDLDCPETVELAPGFLWSTWAFGRASRLRSHWLYVSPGVKPMPLSDETGKTLVELRASGQQTVFPPSRHPSGEVIAFDADMADGTDAPRTVDAAELAERVIRLAMAAELRRAGWSADDATADALAERPRLRRPPPVVQRPRNVGNAYERARAYLARMPEAVAFQGGDQALWRAALAMVRGFALSEADALRLLEDEYNPRCVPPWPPSKLRRKVHEAAKSNRLPLGHLLDGGARNV